MAALFGLGPASVKHKTLLLSTHYSINIFKSLNYFEIPTYSTIKYTVYVKAANLHIM